MQQLSGQDASFLYFETANAPMHIGSFALYDPSTATGPFDYQKIVDNTAKRLHLYEDCLRASFEDLRIATLGPSQGVR